MFINLTMSWVFSERIRLVGVHFRLCVGLNWARGS